MSIFAEPDELLCGHRATAADAICVRRYPHDGQEHDYEATDRVLFKLRQTCTPCQWHEAPPTVERV